MGETFAPAVLGTATSVLWPFAGWTCKDGVSGGTRALRCGRPAFRLAKSFLSQKATIRLRFVISCSTNCGLFFGNSEFALRSLSALFETLALPVFYLVESAS